MVDKAIVANKVTTKKELNPSVAILTIELLITVHALQWIASRSSVVVEVGYAAFIG
jgi:hypothetical protein